MSNELAITDGTAKALSIIGGDLKALNPQERVEYYLAMCEGNDLDARTKPYEYIDLRGKIVLYLTGGGAAQIASKRGVSTEITYSETENGCRVVRARAWEIKTGRSTESSAYVPIDGLKGEAYGNACMKAETKAKRRAIIALTGMTAMDETELETTPAKTIAVDHATGEIMETRFSPPPPQLSAKPETPAHVAPLAERIKAACGKCNPATLSALLKRDIPNATKYLSSATTEQLAELDAALAEQETAVKEDPFADDEAEGGAG